MNLLFITPRFPYPPFRGDQSVPFHRMRILSKKHNITLLSLYEHPDELKGLEVLNQFCSSIYTVQLPKWKSFRNMTLLGSVSRLPFQVLYYKSKDFKKCLDGVLRNNNFDIIHAFMLRLGPLCHDISTPVVLDLIDSMQLNFQRRLDTANVPKKWLLKEELRRLAYYEAGICSMVNRLIVVSNKDKEHISSVNVDVVPLGIDTVRFSPSVKVAQRPTIIFSGNMFYGPNIQAVKWFTDKCFFRIQEIIPDVSFVIAGNGPPAEIRELGNKPGITVTGFVDSMPDMLNKASLAIAPMQSGSGMQFKILEAMSCGLPVVTNSLGLGDIKAMGDVELLLAETADDFIEKIVSVLNCSVMAKHIGNNARAFVINRHSWEHTTAMVEDIYTQVITDAFSA
jgi:polysaccharide biosynthesis protein PslH